MLIVDNFMIRGLPLAAFFLHFLVIWFSFHGGFYLFVCLLVCFCFVFLRYRVIVLSVLHTSVCCRAGGMDFSEELC